MRRVAGQPGGREAVRGPVVVEGVEDDHEEVGVGNAGVTAGERREQEAYLAGNYGVTWCSWMGTSVAGIVLANLIPSAWGLGFAGVLCLIGILCSLASTPSRLMAALVAGAAAVAAYAFPLKLNIVVAIAVAVLLCLALEKQPPHDAAGHAA